MKRRKRYNWLSGVFGYHRRFISRPSSHAARDNLVVRGPLLCPVSVKRSFAPVEIVVVSVLLLKVRIV
jgi:hypothetical protein